MTTTTSSAAIDRANLAMSMAQAAHARCAQLEKTVAQLLAASPLDTTDDITTEEN